MSIVDRAGEVRLAWAGLLVVVGLAWPSSAEACVVCATADATLAPVDGEAAFAGRLQATLDLREGWGAASGITVTDRRTELGVHYAPVATWLLSLELPALVRTVAPSGTARATEAVAGDVSLRVDHVSTRRLPRGLHQRLGAFFALKLPTAPLERVPRGGPLPSALQPGCGSFVAAGGLTYSLARGAWSTSAALSVALPFAVRDGFHAGDSLRAGARVAYQPWRVFALRAGADVTADTMGVLAAGVSDPSSGGLTLYAAAEVVASPAPDLTVAVGALLPAVERLDGDHREGPIALATVAYDF